MCALCLGTQHKKRVIAIKNLDCYKEILLFEVIFFLKFISIVVYYHEVGIASVTLNLCLLVLNFLEGIIFKCLNEVVSTQCWMIFDTIMDG